MLTIIVDHSQLSFDEKPTVADQSGMDEEIEVKVTHMNGIFSLENAEDNFEESTPSYLGSLSPMPWSTQLSRYL